MSIFMYLYSIIIILPYSSPQPKPPIKGAILVMTRAASVWMTELVKIVQPYNLGRLESSIKDQLYTISEPFHASISSHTYMKRTAARKTS